MKGRSKVERFLGGQRDLGSGFHSWVLNGFVSELINLIPFQLFLFCFVFLHGDAEWLKASFGSVMNAASKTMTVASKGC